jgi:gamma-glutamylcysteine synthetase
MLRSVFDDGFGFEAYAEYALDVPCTSPSGRGQYLDLTAAPSAPSLRAR